MFSDSISLLSANNRTIVANVSIILRRVNIDHPVFFSLLKCRHTVATVSAVSTATATIGRVSHVISVIVKKRQRCA